MHRSHSWIWFFRRRREIEQELRRYLAKNSERLEIYVPGNFGNPGITRVYPKRLLPENQKSGRGADEANRAREAILNFCETPKSKERIFTKLTRRFGDRILRDELSRMIRDGLLKEEGAAKVRASPPKGQRTPRSRGPGSSPRCSRKSWPAPGRRDNSLPGRPNESGSGSACSPRPSPRVRGPGSGAYDVTARGAGGGDDRRAQHRAAVPRAAHAPGAPARPPSRSGLPARPARWLCTEIEVG